ncbi:energy transducer TonB [Myxococcus sp. RHSTA-1-4]|uniref:energy transducer TonB n=1 Tax=Myxococcus sp. RHSTA-1-4 TaxID=2874601 RepID=UPI001CC194BD|nr:energy transducer TonB [Myxococcus sp. RHSTA-1-4]
MHRALLTLAVLLLLASGCRHANLPVLPASHGELSRMMDRYLDDAPEPDSLLRGVELSLSDPRPRVVVEPAEAPAIMAEALRALDGNPTEEQIRQAHADLGGACTAPFPPACEALQDLWDNPRALDLRRPALTREARELRAATLVVIQCRLTVEGKPRDCRVIESAPAGFTDALMGVVFNARYWPAKFAGHPVEVPYVFHFPINPDLAPLTREAQLGWARARTMRFPNSPHAWAHLAYSLAKFEPEDPAYPATLQRLHTLAPEDWWSANELAWHHAQAGRYTEAAPLARTAWRRAPRNAYVLETLAAVSAGLDRCEEAVAHQRDAVAALPKPWPAPERERFQHTLEAYLQKCPGAAPAASH